jgi:hypothetical protein
MRLRDRGEAPKQTRDQNETPLSSAWASCGESRRNAIAPTARPIAPIRANRAFIGISARLDKSRP